MKRGFTKTIAKEEINTDDNVASNPLKSKTIVWRSDEHVIKRGFIRTVVLPEKGIYADDGVLFHHVSMHPSLTPAMISRLQEHGVPYIYKKRFTYEEDEIIRNNWKEFAEEYNIPKDTVLEYIGMGDRSVEYQRAEINERRMFQEKANFWPRMCKGLDGRCGHQIQLRMKMIFHESVLNGTFFLTYGKRGRALQFVDLINYVEAYPKCKYNQQETVKAVGINLHRLGGVLPIYLSHYGKVQQKHWKCLWNTVDRLVEVFPITKTFGQIYRKAIMRRDRCELAKLSKSINFRAISNVMLKNIKSCKEGWDELTEELLKEYIKAYNRVNIGKDAFEEACNKVFAERAFITPDRYSLFLRLLLKCLKENAISKTKMKKKYFHMDRLANMMLGYGISGFHVFDLSMSEVECMYSHAKIHLSECDKELPSNISRTLALKEKIQLFTKAYDMQFRHLTSSKLIPVEGENCKKNYVITKDGFPCFKMRIYYRVVFKYLDSQRLDDSDSNSSNEEDLSN